MVLHTWLTRSLGIRHPIIQGGMHHVGFAELAAAVSNAGGLGIITALTQPSADALRDEIQKTKELTDKVVEDEKIPCIETAGHFKGLEPFVRQFKAAGSIVIHKCTQVRHAKAAERMGVDCISMDGFDCAGHPGEMDVGNWILFAKAARELKIPFVASGGCADGKQLAAALALGAEGMNMGTRFMATVEAPIHANIKQALVDGDEHSTTLIMRSLKNTERVFNNKTAKKVLEIEAEFPGQFEKIQPWVSGNSYKNAFQVTGDVDEGVWSAGQVMGLIDDIPTCEQLIKDIVDEAEEVITGRLPGMVGK